MKTEMREIYICESCGDVFLYPWKHNSERCAREKKERMEEAAAYDRRTREVTELVVIAAKQDKALKVLVQNGLLEEARYRANDLYDSLTSWDTGCSHGMEAILTAMLEAAK